MAQVKKECSDCKMVIKSKGNMCEKFVNSNLGVVSKFIEEVIEVDKIDIIFVIGKTASGKTELSSLIKSIMEKCSVHKNNTLLSEELVCDLVKSNFVEDTLSVYDDIFIEHVFDKVVSKGNYIETLKCKIDEQMQTTGYRYVIVDCRRVPVYADIPPHFFKESANMFKFVNVY